MSSIEVLVLSLGALVLSSGCGADAPAPGVDSIDGREAATERGESVENGTAPEGDEPSSDNATGEALDAHVEAAAAGTVGADPAGAGVAAGEVELCGRSMSLSEFDQLLRGSLVIAARHDAFGLAPLEAALGFALELALNGIDFGALGRGSLEFANGAYVFRNGDAMIGLRFVLTEDLGEWTAGTVLSHDLLDPASFFTGIDVDADFDLSWSDPGVDADVSIQHGPLFELVEGEIEFDGIEPASASLRLRTDVIAVEIVTEQSYAFESPRENDELTIVMDSAPIPLDELGSLGVESGLGLDMTGTHVYSAAHDLDQVFTRASFTIREADGAPSSATADEADGASAEAWVVAGSYDAVLRVGDLVLFEAGQAHTVRGNWSDLYCDAEQTERVGRLTHALDLTGGTFEFESGQSYHYGLAEAPSLQERLNPN